MDCRRRLLRSCWRIHEYGLWVQVHFSGAHHDLGCGQQSRFPFVVVLQHLPQAQRYTQVGELTGAGTICTVQVQKDIKKQLQLIKNQLPDSSLLNKMLLQLTFLITCLFVQTRRAHTSRYYTDSSHYKSDFNGSRNLCIYILLQIWFRLLLKHIVVQINASSI